MRTPLCLTLALFVCCALAACGTGDSADSTGATDAQIEADQVTVEDFQFAQIPGGERIVTGDLVNASAQPIRNAQVKITLYDADNRRVADMSVSVQDIGPGERKGFREPIDTDRDVQGAKVRSVLIL